MPTQVLADSVDVAHMETRMLDLMASDGYKTPGPPPPM
jgi:hypothetical protein